MDPSVSLGTTTNSASVRQLTPSSGSAGGGDRITVTGSGFAGATAVYFGTNISSDFSVDSPTSITAIAPVGTGTVDVRVVMPDGATAVIANHQFTYVPTGQQPITASGYEPRGRR